MSVHISISAIILVIGAITIAVTIRQILNLIKSAVKRWVEQNRIQQETAQAILAEQDKTNQILLAAHDIRLADDASEIE